ncbi:hypothetical protein [Streptomyces sp. NPDC003483]
MSELASRNFSVYVTNAIPEKIFLKLFLPRSLEKRRRAWRSDCSATRIKIVGVVGEFVLARGLYCSNEITLGDHVRLNCRAQGPHYTLGWVTVLNLKKGRPNHLLIRFDEELTDRNRVQLRRRVNLYIYKSDDNDAACQMLSENTIHLLPNGGGSHPHIRGWVDGERQPISAAGPPADEPG